jgi:cephalosporin hydroxylase
MYQEILFEIRPELVIETGTAFGGSALFLATMLEVLGTGEVLSIDIAQKPSRPTHRRLFYRIGSSTSPEILKEAGERARAASRVVVILESDHRKSHVLEELNRYAPLVTPGSYLIVEDTHINGNPVFKDFGPGPREAVLEFLLSHPEFEPDHSKERFLMTFNPGGFLKRRSP